MWCQRTVHFRDDPSYGRQDRLQMPDTIDNAMNKATVATNAETEDRASRREDRGK